MIRILKFLRPLQAMVMRGPILLLAPLFGIPSETALALGHRQWTRPRCGAVHLAEFGEIPLMPPPGRKATDLPCPRGRLRP